MPEMANIQPKHGWDVKISPKQDW